MKDGYGGNGYGQGGGGYDYNSGGRGGNSYGDGGNRMCYCWNKKSLNFIFPFHPIRWRRF